MNLEVRVKEKHFHFEVFVLRMNVNIHSQNLEANYENYMEIILTVRLSYLCGQQSLCSLF
jgi:hypothetical protein